MNQLETFITGFAAAKFSIDTPWALTAQAKAHVELRLGRLGDGYIVKDDVAIHQSALVEKGCILKGPIVIGPQCFIGAHAYLRNGVWLDENVGIGPGCEVKSSFIFNGTRLAHFNFVGDSVLGSNVNMEAGAVIANYFNERADKSIFVRWNNGDLKLDTTKFGALVADGCRIGANAVLSPGTILPPNSIVSRLQLIDQRA
ncbi:MAG: LpxA family transferase [Bacteroidia bacterium]|nr:LpxA family transferase [Bacteroidia bacterium]